MPARDARTGTPDRHRRVLGRLSPLKRRRSTTSRPTGAATGRSGSSCCCSCCRLFAELIANDKPIVVCYDGQLYFPVFVAYPETTFGGDFQTEADYRDPVS